MQVSKRNRMGTGHKCLPMLLFLLPVCVAGRKQSSWAEEAEALHCVACRAWICWVGQKETYGIGIISNKAGHDPLSFKLLITSLIISISPMVDHLLLVIR